MSGSRAHPISSLVQPVPTVIRKYGPEKVGPGDGILANHPFRGGLHLNDITLIFPVFYRGAAK
jgi:N-methylhydantoinase B